MLIDPDDVVQKLYEQAGMDDRYPVTGKSFAARLIGLHSIELVGGLKVSALYSAERDRILVKRGLALIAFNYVVFHELAERYCVRLGYDDPDRETMCNAIAARLAAPRNAVRLAAEETDGTVFAIARWLNVSETIAFLRMGEVFHTPIALITPRWIAVRGEEREWGAPDVLRAIAYGRHEAPVEKLRLSDADRRVGLIAA